MEIFCNSIIVTRMQTKYSAIIPLLILSCSVFISCRKDSKVNSGKITVPVETLKAGVENTDISIRSNWKLVLYHSYYIAKVNGDTVTGTPEAKPHSFLTGSDDLMPLLPDEEPGIFFFSVGYIDGPEFLVVKDGPPAFPNIRDQATLNDLVNADMLFGKYSGFALKNLSNIKLVHANALLDFETENLPAGAELKLLDLGRPFTPFQYEANHYQAIVTGNWHSTTNTSVSVKTATKEYKADIINNADLKGNTRYHFKLTLNNEQLVVENLDTSSWGAAQWPDI
jgi:hypothetical protein